MKTVLMPPYGFPLGPRTATGSGRAASRIFAGLTFIPSRGV